MEAEVFLHNGKRGKATLHVLSGARRPNDFRLTICRKLQTRLDHKRTSVYMSRTIAKSFRIRVK